MWISKTKNLTNFLLDILYPKICLSCQKEGSWLCEDCISTLEIQNWAICPICQKRVLDFKTCPNCRPKTKLIGLFTPLSYQNPTVKNAIHNFKYEPFAKELAKPLAFIITSHLKLIEHPDFDKNFILIPIPLHKSRLRWRGYNQSEEIAKELSLTLKIPLENNCLKRVKSTEPQMKLDLDSRFANIQDAFLCQNKEKLKGKKVLLVDDVYTTGSTMEECAKVLKQNGAKEIFGAVIARE